MKELISMRLGADGFAQHWKHCDLVANYLATFTSELLDKSESHANLVSTVLNELLEVIFRRNSGEGDIRLTLVGEETEIVVEILVPVEEDDRKFYQEMARVLQTSDLGELHRNLLSDSDDDATEHNLSLSLLELAAVHNAILRVRDVAEGGAITLELPFQIEP